MMVPRVDASLAMICTESHAARLLPLRRPAAASRSPVASSASMSAVNCLIAGYWSAADSGGSAENSMSFSVKAPGPPIAPMSLGLNCP